MRRVAIWSTIIFANWFAMSSVIAETWVDRSGSFRIEAEFVGVQGKEVALKKSDGSIIRVPIAKLSDESIAQAKQLYEASKPKLGGGAAVGAAGASLGENPTLQQTVDFMNEVAKTADPGGVWELMPTTYRNDVNELVRLFAESVDTQTWGDAVGVIDKLHRLLDEKSEFLINSSLNQNADQKEKLGKALKEITPMLKAILASDLCDQSTMKTFDGDVFFQTQYPPLKDRALAIAEFVKETIPQASQQAGEVDRWAVVSEDGDSAIIKITSATRNEEVTCRRVGNRWVLDSTADKWAGDMGKARTMLESLETPEGKQSLAQVRQMIMVGSGMLEPMLKAKTQAEFDQAASGLAAMATMMMPKGQPQ
jgi:hypothetical protein